MLPSCSLSAKYKARNIIDVNERQKRKKEKKKKEVHRLIRERQKLKGDDLCPENDFYAAQNKQVMNGE